MAAGQGKVERVKACLVQEESPTLAKVEVADTESLERLARRLDLPVLECGADREQVVDARAGVLYELRKKSR